VLHLSAGRDFIKLIKKKNDEPGNSAAIKLLLRRTLVLINRYSPFAARFTAFA